MPRNPQGIYSLPAGNPVVSGTLIESTWANPTMSDIAAALTGSVPRDGSAGMQAQLLLVDQTANPPGNGQMAISVDYLTNVLENYQSGAQGGAGNPIIFENDRMAVVDYTITNGKNGMTAGPFGINSGVTIGIPSGSTWTIVGSGSTSGSSVALSDSFPLMDGIPAPGVGLFASRNDHVHPSDTSRAAADSAALVGIPTAPTAPNGTNTDQIATTAFVLANSGGGGGTPSDTIPLVDVGTGAAGTSTAYSRGDHVHPISGPTTKAAFNTACTDGDFAFLNSDNIFANKQQFNAGLIEKYASVAVSTIDCSLASVFSKTVDGAITFAVSNVAPTGNVNSFILELTNPGTNVTFWTGVKWAGGTVPTLTTTGVDVLGFYTHDGGTTWRGSVLAKDSK